MFFRVAKDDTSHCRLSLRERMLIQNPDTCSFAERKTTLKPGRSQNVGENGRGVTPLRHPKVVDAPGVGARALRGCDWIRGVELTTVALINMISGPGIVIAQSSLIGSTEVQVQYTGP